MPPKQSKADLAKKQKVVEDKTFGLKNKNKSKNVQKYVQSLKQSVEPRPDPTKVAVKKKKEEEKAREKELNDLFKVAVTQPKVPVGVDPKSILCEFFKAGQCQKGFKCKFSHDLNIQRKGEKIDIYSDKRDGDKCDFDFFLGLLFEETMEDWDQETLEKVVESKKMEYNQNKPTEIVCKYFLEAVEKKQYGWFWVCPNGGKECHYRHALPPGYILKSQMKALLEEESDRLPIEDEIEDQRGKLKSTTPMTTELFMQWKKKKMEERNAGLAAQQAERAKNDRMSGRELFLSNASLFVDDAEAFEEYHREEEAESNEQKGKDESATSGPSNSSGAVADSEEILPDDDDDDELDLDELNELEASLSRTSIQICEPGIEASS
ncbi:zinc finger CCCH domain-containing protein 21 [Citrus sinensis]|uniref:Zinc finger CCCH domain-containing protein 21 n=2 Tax=Citrus sinensis TaxID=2711 RepID=A0ACB8L435_CITSI|nr:zinc finger CCCH domain-containing protein 21 [Citrus sinensis]KAH9768045.1 zinc finger CCCH domain-containing protein 21 [Citrus sinensis]